MRPIMWPFILADFWTWKRSCLPLC